MTFVASFITNPRGGASQPAEEPEAEEEEEEDELEEELGEGGGAPTQTEGNSPTKRSDLEESGAKV